MYDHLTAKDNDRFQLRNDESADLYFKGIIIITLKYSDYSLQGWSLAIIINCYCYGYRLF